MRISILLFFVMLCVCPGIKTFAQETDAFEKIYSILKYNERDPSFVFDVGYATGFISEATEEDVFGLGSFRAQADFFHLLAGYGYDYVFDAESPFDDASEMSSLHLGYRYRSQKLMIALMSGFTWPEQGTPIELQADYIVTGFFSAGFQVRYLNMDSFNSTSIVAGVKFGMFRGGFKKKN